MFSPTYFPRQRWVYPKDHERNFVAAFFHMITITLICISAGKLGWFRVWGGHCISHLAMYQFFSFGYFDRITTQEEIHLPGGEIITSPVTIQYHSSNEILPCVTPEVANLMRIMITLCILAVFSSLVGFCLDVFGPTKKILNNLRKNAIPSIATVLLVTSVIGVCYLISRSLEITIYEMNPHVNVQVAYEYGCYTITAAGAVSVLATACNLLQPQSSIQEDNQRHRLVEDWDGLETFSVGMRNIPLPPPPYTP